MNTSDPFALSCYQEIALLNKEHDIALVQHTATGRVYVRKRMSIYNVDVYRHLYEHPVKGLPAIFEVFERDGILTVIEEYISGTTLRSILDDGNLFDVADAVRIIERLCLILRELHSAHPPIIHRDIKPSNIMIASDDSVRLLDMNVAKFSSADKAEDTSMLGTFGYAAPEQFGFGSSNAQTDLYSVGVLLCEMITGHLPKESMPEGPIAEIIMKCTRIDPGDRYRSVDELLDALLAFRRSCGMADSHAAPMSPEGMLRPAFDSSTRLFPGTPSALQFAESGSTNVMIHSSEAHDPNLFRSSPAHDHMVTGSNADVPVHPNAIPGFRTGNPSNMIIATAGYAALLFIGLTLTSNTPSSIAFLWIERIATVLCGLFVVFFTCNYRNLWHFFRIDRIRSNLWKIPAILLVDVGVSFLFVIITAFFASAAGL
ncbi:MAG: serine/threonine-protein kinase [Eubacteriales bacterium]|nr:serine/threonine-protein kinase [Eubacteriales bacterium]